MTASVVPLSGPQFAAAFESAPIGMALLGEGAGVLRANRAMCRMLGYEEEELLDLTANDVTHPDDVAEDLDKRRQLVAGLIGSYQREKRYLHRDGRIVWGHVSCTLARDPDGGTPVVLVQAQDITSLKQAEAAQREQAQLLDHARDAIVVHGLDGRVLYWNKGAERLFGWPAEEARDQTFAELLGPGGALGTQAEAQLLHAGEWVGELKCIAANGLPLTVERRCTVVRDEAGRPAKVLAINTDVTERRRAEKEIVLLNSVLESRIRQRTWELQESNEELRSFAYSVAHDLRAPIASVAGFSHQLEKRVFDRLDDKERHYLSRVRAGIKLMGDLTDALLELADLSRANMLRQSVDLSSIARTILSNHREQEPEREVQDEVQDTPRAEGDVRLLTDLMENLLANAWKFTGKTAGAKICFGAEVLEDGQVVYCVKDNGAGFDPAYAHKLFGTFQRLHTVAEFEGTGIGLAIVRKIVARHGGRVWAESGDGPGARFFFTLNDAVSVRR